MKYEKYSHHPQAKEIKRLGISLRKYLKANRHWYGKKIIKNYADGRVVVKFWAMTGVDDELRSLIMKMFPINQIDETRNTRPYTNSTLFTIDLERLKEYEEEKIDYPNPYHISHDDAKQYAEHYGEYCPVCKHWSIQGNDVEFGGLYASRDMKCYHCGAEYTEQYTLTGLSFDNQDGDMEVVDIVIKH